MDPAVVKVLHDAFKKGMEEQSYKDSMAKLDQEAFYLNTADYQRLRDEADRRAEAARRGAGAAAAVAASLICERSEAIRALKRKAGLLSSAFARLAMTSGM